MLIRVLPMSTLRRHRDGGHRGRQYMSRPCLGGRFVRLSWMVNKARPWTACLMGFNIVAFSIQCRRENEGRRWSGARILSRKHRPLIARELQPTWMWHSAAARLCVVQVVSVRQAQHSHVKSDLSTSHEIGVSWDGSHITTNL